jgi:hypothetical protein
VKKVSKAILIGLAALIVLVLALLVGLNLYVQSPGAQARIQEELSKALHMPLKLTNTSVSPWSDLRIAGITIPDGEANFLEAKAFTASYRLLPLLDSKLIITEMRVENPKIVLRQTKDGKWKLPEPEKAAEISREESQPSAVPGLPVGTAAVPPDAPVSEAPAREAEKVVRKEKKAKKRSDFAVTVNRFEVKNGLVELLAHDLQHVAVFNEVNMTYTTLTPERVEGTATIGRAVWADGLTLENVRTPFSYADANQEFSLPEITAILAGGSLRGKYHSRKEAEHSPFTASAEFENIDVDRLVTQTGGEAGQATGEIRGQFALHGDTDRFEKAEGSGRLDLRDGQFRQLEFFQNIGQVLGLRELSNLRLKEGHSELRLSGDKIYVEKLLLTTSDLQLSSTGIVHLNKKVALEAQLSVEEALVKQLPGMVRDSFTVAADNRRAIDFKITGTTEKLKTNLLDKLIGQKVNAQFGDLLGSLFGSDRKPEEDKKKKEEGERKKAEKKDKNKKDKDKDKTKDREKGAMAPSADSAAEGAAPVPVTSANP